MSSELIAKLIYPEEIIKNGENKMSKGQDSKRGSKKAPQKTKAEKRAAKRAKQEEKNRQELIK